LDLGLTATSGQVFRWGLLPDEGWLGVDGDHWYVVRTPQGRATLAWDRYTGGNRDAERDALQTAERRPIYSSRGEDEFEVTSNGTAEDFYRLILLDWNDDEVAAELVRLVPELKPYMAAMSGLRLMRPSDPVESFFSFLCSANNNLPRITSMVRHLATYGVPMEAEELPVNRFPSVRMLADIPAADLRARSFGYRADTITRIARELLERGG
jgi:N-glycosylase/DNA lyase